ncbi:type IV secretion system DNA-binding domain-containing protein [Leptothoe spongobia]|uniref:Type IV secretion system DNA-binding domain-containing protein n=1 Tax=Leptothoe spongobia TAU-MAC 1115 TaxID=1967444 RepID=A0A947DJR3_9CYAN|nr:type IV secretion system DNA-binding domain-containing protein [Leptothoe spongobia]MBT9317749.1 type IV secretion system DNA-binding domain-containing protein [Leptothoe spongobia TAU-MAC 1115]
MINRRSRQQLVTRYDHMANQLASHSHQLPKPLATFVKQSPRVALGIVLALGLYLVFQLMPDGVGFLLFAVGYFVIHTGSWIWLIKKRQDASRLTTSTIVISVLAYLLIPFIPFLPHLCLLIGRSGTRVNRGTRIVSATELARILAKDQAAETRPIEPLLEIGGIALPNRLENLGFFFVGSPGSGKTQAIKQVLSTLKTRRDFRAILLDRNGELLESFYDPRRDLIFNPSDARSVLWSHQVEGIDAETIAASLIPDDSKDRFFSEAAKTLLADIYERCDDNTQIWEVISSYSFEELRTFLKGGVSARYFESEKTGASVISTLVNSMRFYRQLPAAADFSFSEWGRRDDARWLFLPVFEDTAERYKALYSMAFELMLKGLLSNESRSLKTALVIDELGALNHLPSLARLLSESRKFGGTAILGTQTEAQIDKVYGEHDRRILLQGTATKLILNCRDEGTAKRMANVIGKQERVEHTRSKSIIPGIGGARESEQIRETHAVMPAELQALPSLEGYLSIANGTPPAKVRVEPRSYPVQAERFIPNVG